MALTLQPHLAQPWSPARSEILVVGDAMLDVYVLGAVDRISPEAPVPVVKYLETTEQCGGAANVAINIARLGGVCHLISCCGMDDEGNRLSRLLHREGISCDLIGTQAKQTTVKTRFSVGQHQLLRLDREESSAIPPPLEDEVLAAIAARMATCRLVVVSDYNKGVLTDRVLRETIAMARTKAVPVLVDPKRQDFSAYCGATIIKPNRRELEIASGLPVVTDADVELAGSAVAAATRAAIVVTRAKDGLSLIRPPEPSIHMSAQVREVFDVTGAGDSMMAAFAVGLVSGCSIEQAMAFGNLAGGIAVSKRGTVVVTASELESERSRTIQLDVSPAKIVSEFEAVRLRKLWGNQELVVGFTNGCFDLLHPGHVALLRKARSLCDRLIVGLNSDDSIRHLKGSTRPVQTCDARATVLAAMEPVDLIVAFNEDTPARLIDLLVPDVLVKGADYELDRIVGAETVRAAGGRVVSVPLVPDQSTTSLIIRQ